MKFKSLLAFLLLFAMLLGTFPLAIAAEEATEPEAQTTETDGVNLSIDDDLAVRYHTANGEVSAVSFTIAGKEPVTVTSYTTDGEGKKVFTFDGIGPHQIDKAIKIEANGTVIEEAFTITGYCETLLTTYPDDTKLAAVIGDLLAYGKAAQNYLKITSTIDATVDKTAIPKAADHLKVTDEAGILGTVKAGVRFDSVNRIYFKIPSADGNFTAAIDGVNCTPENIGGGYYIVYSDAIAPVNYRDVKTLTITVGENSATVEYSVNTYAYRMQNDSEMGELAKALFCFGRSCVEYTANVVIEEDYTGKSFYLSGNREGAINHNPNNSAAMKTVTGADENTYLRIDKTIGGSNAIVYSSDGNGLAAFKTNVASFEISFSKVEDVKVTKLLFQLIGNGNPELFSVDNEGIVKLTGGTKTLGTVTEDGFTKIRIAVDLTSKSVTAYDEKGDALETVTVNTIDKTKFTSYLFYINLRQDETLATAVLIDDIRVADGNIFGNGTTENNIVIDEDYTGESFDISGSTTINTYISPVNPKPNNSGATMQTVADTNGNTYLRVDKPVHANNSLIYKNDGKGLAAFKTNVASFEISFSKVKDVKVTELTFETIDSGGKLFTVNNSGEVYLNGGDVKLGTLTEDGFTKIRIALDFDSGKVTAYGGDGEILDTVTISINKSNIKRYILYINVKQNASLDTAVLIDDIRIIDGNNFAI